MKQTKSTNSPIAHEIGRRKRAVARVWARRGTGKLRVNGQDYTEYFETPEARMNATGPMTVCKQSSSYDFAVTVEGGGFVAQSGAVRLGIARVLDSVDASNHEELKKHGMLTRDPREKERKKYGQRGARRKFQFVKR